MCILYPAHLNSEEARFNHVRAASDSWFLGQGDSRVSSQSRTPMPLAVITLPTRHIFHLQSRPLLRMPGPRTGAPPLSSFHHPCIPSVTHNPSQTLQSHESSKNTNLVVVTSQLSILLLLWG